MLSAVRLCDCHEALDTMLIDAAIFGWVQRKRLYWAAGPRDEDLLQRHSTAGGLHDSMGSKENDPIIPG